MKFELQPTRPEAQGKAEAEHYPTPPELAAEAYRAVYLLHARSLDGRHMRVLEPGCGDGAPFLRAATMGVTGRRLGCDVREIGEPVTGASFLSGVDFLDVEQCFEVAEKSFAYRSWDLIITNPPFSMAVEFVERSLELVHPFGLVAMLLQTGIEASKKRVEFWRRHPFVVKYNLVPRPVFIKGGDMREYAIYVWPGPALAAALRNLGRSWSEVRVLNWR